MRNHVKMWQKHSEEFSEEFKRIKMDLKEGGFLDLVTINRIGRDGTECNGI